VAGPSLLDPLDELLERGQSPGEIVLERWQGEWSGSADRLIDSTRY
jgi:gamma-glutamylcysteine synthetase